MTLSKCAICGSEKSRFIKNQEAKGLLSDLGLRKPLSKVPILGDILFWMYKMNKTFNITKNPEYDGYQKGIASMVYKFFDKKPEVAVLIMKLNKINNWLKNYTYQLLKN